MKKETILGIILIIISIILFATFLWWGTTNYKDGYAVGIFVASGISFITGLISIHNNIIP